MTRPALAEEAIHLHSCLFSEPLEPQFISRYEAVHRKLFSDDRLSPLMATVVERRLDVQAVELALRRRGMGRELTRKLQIVCYLAEPRESYAGEFVTAGGSPVKAWMSLAVSAFQSGWKLIKGEYLIHKYHLP